MTPLRADGTNVDSPVRSTRGEHPLEMNLAIGLSHQVDIGDRRHSGAILQFGTEARHLAQGRTCEKFVADERADGIARQSEHRDFRAVTTSQ